MFGSAFYREHSDMPLKLWRHAFAKLSDAQIATGLANLGNDNLAFPPNLSQFVSACKRTTRSAYGVKALPDLSDDARKREADKAWEYMESLAGRKLRPE